MAPTFVGLGITPERTLPDGRKTYNDLSLTSDGNLRLVIDAEAVGEHARQRLLFYKGEWRYDPGIGVDWYGQVHGFSETRQAVAEAVIKREILQTPGVTELREVETRYERGNRGLYVENVRVATQFDDDAEFEGTPFA